jgi:hypothetical protein
LRCNDFRRYRSNGKIQAPVAEIKRQQTPAGARATMAKAVRRIDITVEIAKTA